MQLPPHCPYHLGQTALDGHVDVLVVRADRERAAPQLVGDLLQPAVQLVALGLGDDPHRGQHRGVRPRLLDVIRAQADVERDRVVQRPEGVIGGLAEAGHDARQRTWR